MAFNNQGEQQQKRQSIERTLKGLFTLLEEGLPNELMLKGLFGPDAPIRLEFEAEDQKLLQLSLHFTLPLRNESFRRMGFYLQHKSYDSFDHWHLYEAINLRDFQNIKNISSFSDVETDEFFRLEINFE